MVPQYFIGNFCVFLQEVLELLWYLTQSSYLHSFMVLNSISVPLNSPSMQDAILQECLRGLCLTETLSYRKYQSEKCCHSPLHKIKE